MVSDEEMVGLCERLGKQVIVESFYHKEISRH